MKQNGIQFTCDGCGITTFIEDPTLNIKNLKPSHNITGMLQREQSESWARVDVRLDLCPRCQKIWTDMLCRFYECVNSHSPYNPADSTDVTVKSVGKNLI